MGDFSLEGKKLYNDYYDILSLYVFGKYVMGLSLGFFLREKIILGES